MITKSRVFFIEGVNPDGTLYPVGYCGNPGLMARVERGRGLNDDPGKVTVMTSDTVPEGATVWHEEADLPDDVLAFVRVHDEDLSPRNNDLAPDEQLFGDMEGEPA